MRKDFTDKMWCAWADAWLSGADRLDRSSARLFLPAKIVLNGHVIFELGITLSEDLERAT